LKNPLHASVVLIALIFLGSCRRAETGSPALAAPFPTVALVRTYPALGVIEGFQSDNKIVVIHHQAITGLMSEMTMAYELQNPSQAQGLKVGDAVQFTLSVSGDDTAVTALKKR